MPGVYFFFFFFNDTATPEIYPLSLHDALPIWVVAAYGARQAAPGDEADPRADELDGRHQREGRERGPEHPVAERGARDGVGRDAARIVVRRARDEPRPEELEVADERVVTVA